MPSAQYDALRTGAGFLPATDRRWISVEGSERAEYLQGLLTNDVAALTPGTGCYATYLTPQGRIVADMIVVADADRMLLEVDHSVKDRLCERFDDLIFSEDVTIDDLGESLTSIEVHGPNAAELVADATGAPAGSLGIYEHSVGAIGENAVIVLRTDDLGGILGLRVVGAPATLPPVASALRDRGAIAVERDATDVVRIESGRPAFPDDLDAETIPLEAGIETRAIDFDKGCYVGQEVIIRILHRGQGRVARRLGGLSLEDAPRDDDSRPTKGGAVWKRGGDDAVGRITSVAFSPALDAMIALAYLPRELSAEAGTSMEVEVAGSRRPATITTLPFVTAS